MKLLRLPFTILRILLVQGAYTWLKPRRRITSGEQGANYTAIRIKLDELRRKARQ